MVLPQVLFWFAVLLFSLASDVLLLSDGCKLARSNCEHGPCKQFGCGRYSLVELLHNYKGIHVLDFVQLVQ